jgi:hydroxymethylpyrimidine/phosphomethylpyrimidine kinase
VLLSVFLKLSFMETALTIAGSDSGGGAGIQADLKTFEAYGVFGTTVITAITAQNTLGVHDIWPSPREAVRGQMNAVLGDFDIRAAKTGMLFSAEIIREVAAVWKGQKIPLVVDPVMVATSGDSLFQPDAISAFRNELFPLARVITPNIPEAEALTGLRITTEAEMEAAAKNLSAQFPEQYILVKGGHLSARSNERERSVVDILAYKGRIDFFTAPYIDTPNTHGTGCTLSAAIVANLVKGNDVHQAIAAAKRYVTDAIRYSWANLGKGNGSLRHNFQKLKPSA